MKPDSGKINNLDAVQRKLEYSHQKMTYKELVIELQMPENAVKHCLWKLYFGWNILDREIMIIDGKRKIYAYYARYPKRILQ